jgi:small subunit ribosomal protein S20
MAHSRTAKKAIRQNEARRARNRASLSAMRTQIKKVRAAVAANDADAARTELSLAQAMIDKAAKSNRMHRNRAARIKSQLALAVASA